MNITCSLRKQWATLSFQESRFNNDCYQCFLWISLATGVRGLLSYNQLLSFRTQYKTDGLSVTIWYHPSTALDKEIRARTLGQEPHWHFLLSSKLVLAQ